PAVLVGVSQDALELLVHLSAGPGGSLLGAMGEVDGRLRSRGFLDLHQPGEQQTDGLAVLPVVLQQGGLVLAVPCGLPPVPPHQANPARPLRAGPVAPQEPTQHIQAVRADREVTPAVAGRGHVDKAVRQLMSTAVPPRQRLERLPLVAAVVVDWGAWE